MCGSDPNLPTINQSDLGVLLSYWGLQATGTIRAKFTWDAENRLVGWEPLLFVSGAKKLEFRYDYLGRRVEKKVYTYNGSSWDLSETRRFVWYNWLLLEELDALNGNAIVRKYTWGLDLAGQSGEPSRDRQGAVSLESAAGIGGLLALHDPDDDGDPNDPNDIERNYVYFYDATGNVGQLVAWASDYGGATGYDWHADRLVARYEYDPYGTVIGPDTDGDGDFDDDDNPGPYAVDNPFRFSTKYFDDETALGYWGYRYYSPGLGRWLNRDPIGQPAAVLTRQVAPKTAFVPRDPPDDNLYRFVRNDPVSWIDPDGMAARRGDSASQPSTQPEEDPAGRGKTCGLKIKRSAICTLFPKQSCDFGHEWIEGGGGRWDFPKDYAEDPCHQWDRNHPVWEWNAHVKLFGGKLPNGTSCAQATCSQIRDCLQKQEHEWQRLYESGERPYSFLFHSCINFVDAALNKCCMVRGVLPTRMPKPFEEARLCCERCKEMEGLGCN